MYIVEVKCREGIQTVWRPLRPTGGQPYTYETMAAAHQIMEMCYPDQVIGVDVRVNSLQGEFPCT